MSKEFHNLALVDLTTPLGEDEVLPRNEHYVVPERPVAEPTKSSSARKKSKKKKTKLKKSRPAAFEGDLLGFDAIALGSAAIAGTDTEANNGRRDAVDSVMNSAKVGASDNPINNAFDDLLGLEMPAEPSQNATLLMVPTAAKGAMVEETLVSQKSKTNKQKKEKKKKSKRK